MLKEMEQRLIADYELSIDYLATLIELTKQRLGIMTDVKKESIQARVYSAILEIADERNLLIDKTNATQLMILVDVAAWRYSSVTRVSRYDGVSNPSMPADIRYRLNNYFVNGKQRSDDNDI